MGVWGGPQPSPVSSEAPQGPTWGVGLVRTPRAAAAGLVKTLYAAGRGICPWPDNPSLRAAWEWGDALCRQRWAHEGLCPSHFRHSGRWFIHTGACAGGGEQGHPPNQRRYRTPPAPGRETSITVRRTVVQTSRGRLLLGRAERTRPGHSGVSRSVTRLSCLDSLIQSKPFPVA